MPPTRPKSKKELLTEQIAAAVGAGREVAVETVDFSDPNRPKTCLEVDFPIIPINQIAIIEGNAGKPIYQMSKWWARRRSSVFRSMLLAAAMKAPEDESKAAKAVWDVYYANHQKRGSLRHLKVAEPFMGGGTTIVEGSRLGMQMFGCDLNPVAWFVVKNEMAQVDIEEVKRLLADIEAEVKPLIMPYYACDGPGRREGQMVPAQGHEGSSEESGPGRFRPGRKTRSPSDGRRLGRTSTQLRHFLRAMAGAESTTATKGQKSSTPFGPSTAPVSARAADIARPSCPPRSLPSKPSPWMRGWIGNVAGAGRHSTWSAMRRGWLPTCLCSLRQMRSRLP